MFSNDIIIQSMQEKSETLFADYMKKYKKTFTASEVFFSVFCMKY